MAESTGGQISWWGGWIETIKEKSLSTYEQVKKDLDVYTHTVHSDTFKAVNSTSFTLKDTLQNENSRLKKGLTAFIGELSNVVGEKEGNGDVSEGEGDIAFNRAQARLHTIQMDPATYLDIPQGGEEQFNMWAESFDADAHKGEISGLLVSNVHVRSLYTQMVPRDMSHGVFWRRYFYRIHQVQLDDARKRALMNRAERNRDDSYTWDDDDDESFVDVHVDLSTGETTSSHAPTDASPSRGNDERVPPLTCVVTQSSGCYVDDSGPTIARGGGAGVNDIITDSSASELNRVSRDGLATGQLPHAVGVILDSCVTKEMSSIEAQGSDITDEASFEQTRGSDVTKEAPVEPARGSRLINDKSAIAVDNFTVSNTNVEVTPDDVTEVKVAGAGTEPGVTGAMEIRSKVKGDMVVVGGSSSSSPVSDEANVQNKVLSDSADDEWEDDLDLDVTEEDMKAAEEVAKQLSAAGISPEDEDDWNWD